MKKISPALLLFSLFLLFSSFYPGENPKINSSSSYNSENLIGNWILVKIEAPDTINIVPRSVAMEGLKISSESPAKLPYQKVVLKHYLEKQLKVFQTKLSFRNDFTFDFYRTEQLTYSGMWKIKKKELILEYGETKSTKLNQILSLDAKELILESESHNKKITLYFNRQ